MKKLIIIVLFIPTIVFSQGFRHKTQTLGVGLVAMTSTYYLTDTLPLYKDKACKTLYCNYLPNNYDTTISPIFFKPDYGITYFVVKEKKPQYYKVLFNYSDTAYCRVNLKVHFMSWDTLLLKSTGIRRLTSFDNFIYGEPKSKTRVQDWDSKPYQEDLLTVIGIQGDWIQILDDNTKQTGWIKWKFSDQLAIDIFPVLRTFLKKPKKPSEMTVNTTKLF